jgi:hypothetical protein
LRVGELADAGGNCLAPGELRGAIAPRPRHEFKLARFAVRQRANENGLENAVLPDIAGVMLQPAFCVRRLGTTVP